MIAQTKEYHILLIIADGQVSANEDATVRAIVDASNYALSIVLVTYIHRLQHTYIHTYMVP